MSLVPALPRPAAPAGALHQRRCVRHPAREAAARCPSCGNFFCRECVVEHDGRLLCTDCLARVAATKPAATSRWPTWRRRLALVGAFGFVWFAFYQLGGLLLKIPPAFHDGTLWAPAREIDADR